MKGEWVKIKSLLVKLVLSKVFSPRVFSQKSAKKQIEISICVNGVNGLNAAAFDIGRIVQCTEPNGQR